MKNDDSLVTLIQVNDEVEGSIIVSMPTKLACKVATNLLMEECTELDQNVQDAIGEMGGPV